MVKKIGAKFDIKWFSIGWLKGVHSSSIVNEVIRTNQNFLKKRKQKENTKQVKQLTKQKQANKKQQKQQIFSCTKTP